MRKMESFHGGKMVISLVLTMKNGDLRKFERKHTMNRSFFGETIELLTGRARENCQLIDDYKL